MGTQEYPIKDEEFFQMGSGNSSVMDETGIEDIMDEDETLEGPADLTLLPRLDDSIEESDLVRESMKRAEEDIDEDTDQTLSPIVLIASKSPSSTVQLSPQEKKLIRDSLEEIGWLTQRDRVPSRSRTVTGCMSSIAQSTIVHCLCLSSAYFLIFLIHCGHCGWMCG
jgi:hypothetical protein